MKQETEPIFASLEVLLENKLLCLLPNNDASYWQPFIWDSAEKGEFNVLKLLQAEGWMHPTDPELAVKSWQKIEQRGTATQDDTAAPEWEDRENILEPEAYQLRAEYYQALLNLLQTQLQELKAFKLSCSPKYACYILLGKTAAEDSLCIAPTVPQETGNLGEAIVTVPWQNSEVNANVKDTTLLIKEEIDDILAALTPINIYGHYEGGYNHTYDHKIVCNVGSTDKLALQATLHSSGLFEMADFREIYPNRHDYIFTNYSTKEKGEELYQRYQKLKSFLKKNFYQIVMYRLKFWNLEQIYLVGQLANNDWVGLKLTSEFDYNP